MLFYITKITAIARFAISNVEIRSPRYLCRLSRHLDAENEGRRDGLK